MGVTAAIIFRKGASDLDRALRSVSPWVDRIVAVNTSPDGEDDEGAVAIAESHGADVFRFPWVEDFAAARNHALAQIDEDDWVLNFDSDEELDADQGPKIRELAAGEHRVYTSLVLQPPGFTTGSNARLFPRQGAYWIRAIHEDIRHDPMLEWHQPDLTIRHHGLPGPERHERNLTILEREYVKGDVDGITAAYLAMQLIAMESPDSERIESLANEAIAKMPQHVPVGKRLGMLMAHFWIDQSLQKVQKCADKGFVAWETASLVCGVLTAKGAHQHATHLARQCLTLPWEGMGHFDTLKADLEFYANPEQP